MEEMQVRQEAKREQIQKITTKLFKETVALEDYVGNMEKELGSFLSSTLKDLEGKIQSKQDAKNKV